jgi:NAD(P)-dependent dehydrogenase (short-subunit alcohol dehydrogenase family)
MLISLSGHNALVTGGSDGLGKAIAMRFAQSGANVAVVARRQQTLDKALTDIRSVAQARVCGTTCDVADEAQRSAAVEGIRAELGPVDILVNNAGGAARRPIESLSRAEFIEDLEVKVFAALAMTQLVLPDMKAKRWGRIINTLSSRSRVPEAGSAPSTVSRGAGLTMTKVMSLELAPWGILVNALCAGLIESGQWRRRHRREAPEIDFPTFLQRYGTDIPLGRLGKPDEFANMACFLASDAASYITGASINIDGGLCPIP